VGEFAWPSVGEFGWPPGSACSGSKKLWASCRPSKPGALAYSPLSTYWLLRQGARGRAGGADTLARVRDLFLLDPEVVFLNHGSFGACPAEVVDDLQRWQRELERNPVEFLARRSAALLHSSRERLARFVGARVEHLQYVPNATVGVNIVARSFPLAPGDEVLATDHEYGACDATWARVCAQRGASYRRVAIPLPFERDTFGARLLEAAGPRTRLIFTSHVTSPDGADFPARRALRAGARSRHRHAGRRCACAGPDRTGPGRAGRRLLHRQLPQVAVRAQGCRLPARAARAPRHARRAGDELGPRRRGRRRRQPRRLHRTHDLRAPPAMARHARHRPLPGRAGCDRLLRAQ
jgi:hypothetical protein